ncbi:MAG: glycosyltransferase family 39 protein, partial [Bacteroidales bacterium]|nr:glycosyltransferase family 39 protein [Bacteroidales bacterium]
MKRTIENKHILLLAILILGSLLRMYNLKEIPFTHDELSVVFRTGYDSFRELITEGVMPDVHPAGIQVFMNYWVALFGDSQTAVKIPFILFGIFSIFLVYKLGEEWFGESVGLVSAAFVSALEYMVMHSQTARPYSSGLLFSLLMVYAWQRYLFKPGKYPLRWLLGYILASALCAYNHYFSLLFAALVGVTGVLFIRKKQILPYIFAGVVIFILYIPHLKIFFFQFREKGVEGWLGKPDNDFILEYIGYVFHFSPYVLTLVAGIILAGIISGQTRLLLRNKYFYISLAWFFIPFLTGFFYSRYVNAVLQL